MAGKQIFEDIDLMHYVDDELDARAVAALDAYLEGDDSDGSERARAKVQSLEEMSEILSTYLELEADEVEPRLDAMWEAIREKTQEEAPVREPVARREPASESTGIWASIVRFFEGYRGHILTGAVAAGAAAAIILALRPPEKVPVQVEVPVALKSDARSEPATGANRPTSDEPVVTVPDGAGENDQAGMQLVSNEPSAPEVEELDVKDGSGMVFMMPGESEDDVSATVIFLDFNDVEGPL